MYISNSYPGANIKLRKIECKNDTTYIYLEQNLNDTTSWWFYWNFEVNEANPGDTIFIFENGKVVSPQGPVVSYPDCEPKYYKEDYINETSFKHNFQKGECVRFSFCLPYQLSDFENFYQNNLENKVQRFVLCNTERGKTVPAYFFGNGDKLILFTARHHCCESTGSYALDGTVLSILLSHPELIKNYLFLVVPFIDLDGVENGDQGKDRFPHDPNRDYTDKPIFNSVKSLIELTKNKPIEAVIDFHSPWKWGGLDDEPHIHFAIDSTENETFKKILSEITINDPEPCIRFPGYTTLPKKDLADPHYKCCDYYFTLNHQVNLSMSLETPYGGNLNIGYNPSLLYKWGMHISAALEKTLLK